MKQTLIFTHKTFLLIPFLILILQSITFAGAWTEKKGGGYYKLSFRYLKADKIYNSYGEKVAIPDFTDITIGFYGTYGLTDKITLSLNASLYKNVKLEPTSFTQNIKTDVSGFGDIGVGVKYGFAKIGKTIFSTSLKLGIPTGKYEMNTGFPGLWTGRKDFNQTVTLEAGHSFYPASFYLTGLIAFTNRNEGFSDEFRYLIEGGYKLGETIAFIGRFHGLVSLKNGNDNVYGGFGIFQNNAQYYAYNLEIVYKMTKNFGLSAYYESGGGGKNIISAPVLNAGVFYTL